MTSDHQAAREMADAAGALLLEIRSHPDRQDLRREGDRRSHELLVALQQERFPDDAVLSEEGTDPSPPVDAERLWIVDPLDGTREFGEPERDDWAVHVALVERGELTAGAVSLPARGVTYATDPPPTPARQRTRGPIRIAVSSRKRIISLNFHVVSMWRSGKGSGAGWKALRARWSMTDESLPIE